MASSGNVIDWDQLKPRILQDLADGKNQQQIRLGLAEDPFRVSISKSQLETKLKHWGYRNSLREAEWKVVSHRINKRRKAGKATSQVSVNGFIFSERNVAKAISRYDIPTLAYRLPSPQMPPELSHHLIEIRTPPLSYQSLQLVSSKDKMAQTARKQPNLRLNLAGRVWPQTSQWRGVELSLGQLVAQVFLPAYAEDERFREAVTLFERQTSVSRTYRDRNISAPYMDHEKFLPNRAYDISTDRHDGVPIHRDQMQRSSSELRIQTAVVETLLGLLYGLSNQRLGRPDRETLVSMIDAPAWNVVFPHLRDSLAVINTKIVQAVAEGLFKESLRECNHAMLELSLDLGADSRQRISYFDDLKERYVFSTPLATLCRRHPKPSQYNPEKLILSLLTRNPNVSNYDLLWMIRTRFYAIAESVIRGEFDRVINFSIATSELGEDFWIQQDFLYQGRRRVFESLDPVTPLLVACFDRKQSAEKLSLIRCLLERNVKTDLEAMIIAAGSDDVEVIALLHWHGVPVNGFTPYLGSPLSSACKSALRWPASLCTDLAAIPLLIQMGATPYDPMNMDHENWEFSPLHILALAQERPAVTEAFKVLLENGADINHCATFHATGLYGARMLGTYPDPYWRHAMTPLEFAVWSSRWGSATQLLSAHCELTGKEILLISSTMNPLEEGPREEVRERFRQFLDKLLEKAPSQANARHWNGLTVLQRAIQNDHEDMVLALFAFGVIPEASDFLYLPGNRIRREANVCPLSNSIQMKLVLDAPITLFSELQLVLPSACPEVVRYVLDRHPNAYDSKGLCDVIARLISKDEISYYYSHEIVQDQPPEKLTLDDLREFVSRRTITNRNDGWESTAITIASRAHRVDILRILIGPIQENLRSNGFIPLSLLKEALMKVDIRPDIDEQNWRSLGIWIRYCGMDDPKTRCSPLTAAAMVVTETAAEETVDLLLALNYQPDCWTILVASSQGHLSILQRLKRLECWPRVLNHEDRPDWCPTALQTAVCNEHISTVRFLLGIGTMVDAIDLCPCRPFCFVPPIERYSNEAQIMLPRTALQHAVEKRNVELVTLVLDAGADVNVPAAMDSGATALQIASIQGDIPMMELLVQRGADPYAAGAAKHGRTALSGAAEYGRKDAVELLLAQVQRMTPQRRQQLVEAVCYAEKNAHHIVASILRESLSSQWSSEDEGTREKLLKDSDSSPEHSVLREMRATYGAWDETFEFRTESHSSSEADEETSESLSQDWEHSPEHPALHEPTIEIEPWEETAEDRPGSLRERHESNSNSGVSNGESDIEDPMLFRESPSRFLQEMQFRSQGHDLPQTEELGFNDGDRMSELILRDDTAAWIDEQLNLAGHGVDDMSLDDFSFSNFS